MARPPGHGASFEPRRREIVDRAAALFARRGYAATSITEICDAVGLPHFPAIAQEPLRNEKRLLRCMRNQNSMRRANWAWRGRYCGNVEKMSRLRKRLPGEMRLSR